MGLFYRTYRESRPPLTGGRFFTVSNTTLLFASIGITTATDRTPIFIPRTVFSSAKRWPPCFSLSNYHALSIHRHGMIELPHGRNERIRSDDWFGNSY